jgi:hypothetical protein
VSGTFLLTMNVYREIAGKVPLAPEQTARLDRLFLPLGFNCLSIVTVPTGDQSSDPPDANPILFASLYDVKWLAS